ncbi:MAG: PKD domain-containing protein, partial [Owenweeksia sp.]
FSAIGDTLLFSTYIGGNLNDLPHSLVVNENNQLFILGNTGSNDYPITAQAFQKSFMGGPSTKLRAFAFNTGSDIVISKLSADGTSLLASTFLGGAGVDGINTGIYKNYGDNSRGEIIYADSRVFIISQTTTPSLSLPNAYRDTLLGQQDALIACLSNDLSSIVWGTYFGGAANDAGYSIKADRTDQLVVAGATYSTNLDTLSSTHTTNARGDADGYMALFDRNSGSFKGATYVGTSALDQIFLLDIDENNNLYAFGQTKGTMSITSGLYGTPGAQQFIKKFNSSLTQELWSTTIGSGPSKGDLVPTAFLVDDCFNIYLSGWNGQSNKPENSSPVQGNTFSLPLTPDAEQSVTDGSDFYFMVLGRNANSLIYASYFGGNSHEHVDGGTSRFDPKGTIYQAVCAGCSQESFPTTPGVVSETNKSNNCNLGAIKLDFEATVRSRPKIDFTQDTDTICDTLFIHFSNESINAQIFEWDFGNGRTSTNSEPISFYENFGTYTIRLIATDTNCSISDTSFITVTHDSGTYINPGFTADYIGCDSEFRATFTNSSEGAQAFQWDFGDGGQSQLANPVHFFTDTGTFVVTLTAINTKCKTSETFSDTIVFQDTSVIPEPVAEISLCGDGSVDILLKDDRRRYDYTWDFGNGEVIKRRYPGYRYQEPGIYTIKVSVLDSICNRTYFLEYPIVIQEIISEVFIPNAFSPNGDDINEKLEIFGNRCDGSSEIHIFNRWGEEVFYSEEPFKEFWDAKFEGSPAPMGVYTYHLRNGKQHYRGSITLFR